MCIRTEPFSRRLVIRRDGGGEPAFFETFLAAVVRRFQRGEIGKVMGKPTS